MKSIQAKRQKEKNIVADMIALYCHHHHHTHRHQLCPQCQTLLHYAHDRSDHCPFMGTKTFCINCPVHCYKPDMREQIRIVMRYSGPRMIFHHPITAISHLISVKREKHRLHKQTSQS